MRLTTPRGSGHLCAGIVLALVTAGMWPPPATTTGPRGKPEHTIVAWSDMELSDDPSANYESSSPEISDDGPANYESSAPQYSDDSAANYESSAPEYSDDPPSSEY